MWRPLRPAGRQWWIMPEWPAHPKYLSHDTQRVDGPAKLTGQARYSSDIQAEGWLYGMIYRAKWPAAKVTLISLDKALKVPGIKAAIRLHEANPAPSVRSFRWPLYSVDAVGVRDNGDAAWF